MALILTLVHVAIWITLGANVLYLRRGARRAASKKAAPLPSVTVLIPARNEEANLQRLLPSLRAQRYPAGAEFVVYDDGSEDGTWAVLQEAAAEDKRLRPLRGDGPPPGWLGKPHALYQAARQATGARYLFLDADARLEDARALERLVRRFEAEPDDVVLTGLTGLAGGGARLLVSLVPNAILTGLPWPLVRRVRARSLGAVNGQCWMIRAADYRRYKPHERVRGEVLEDVEIGRYLKGEGLTPVLADVQREVAIFMYPGVAEAWQGFRKNAYLILGGTPVTFGLLFVFFLFTFLLAPFFAPWLVFSLYGLKTATDRLTGFPLWVSLLTPVSFVLAVALQLDSAWSHWTGRVAWKGRRVASS